MLLEVRFHADDYILDTPLFDKIACMLAVYHSKFDMDNISAGIDYAHMI